LRQLARRLTKCRDGPQPIGSVGFAPRGRRVFDLASIKLGIEEIAESIHDGATTDEVRSVIGRE
jgi:hypothetical protein